MRNYAKKSAPYNIPTERRRELRAYCYLAHNDPEKMQHINNALDQMQQDNRSGQNNDDWIREWIILAITRKRSFSYLEANGLPCCRDSWQIYTKRFFHALNLELTKMQIKTQPTTTGQQNKEGGTPPPPGAFVYSLPYYTKKHTVPPADLPLTPQNHQAKEESHIPNDSKGVFPINTQEEFDAIIKRRLDREREKYLKKLEEQTAALQAQIEDLTLTIKKHKIPKHKRR